MLVCLLFASDTAALNHQKAWALLIEVPAAMPIIIKQCPFKHEMHVVEIGADCDKETKRAKQT